MELRWYLQIVVDSQIYCTDLFELYTSLVPNDDAEKMRTNQRVEIQYPKNRHFGYSEHSCFPTPCVIS